MHILRATQDHGPCPHCHKEIKSRDQFVILFGIFAHYSCACEDTFEYARNAEEHARSQQRDCHRPPAHHTRIA